MSAAAPRAATARADPLSPAVLCQETAERGVAETSVGPRTQAGEGPAAVPAGPLSWGEACWPVPVASSRLVKSCYQNGGVLKTAQEAGEETFREEINKIGDRLLTLAKGALVYL